MDDGKRRTAVLEVGVQAPQGQLRGQSLRGEDRRHAGEAGGSVDLCEGLGLMLAHLSLSWLIFSIFWRVLTYLPFFERFFRVLDRFLEVLGWFLEGFREDFR